MSERNAARWILALALAAAVVGWRVFWFLTDDAFIAFRYASNWLAGWGLTWNPPPFRPVEGYTSFLWVAILAGVWKLTGVAPPEAANAISLACGCGTLALVWRLVLRMELPGVSPRGRLALLGLVLAGTVTNRTFLAWLSSGLETALFNLLLTWWLVEALTRPAERGRGWGTRLAAAAAAAALARPDGLLAVIATPLLLALPVRAGWRAGGRARRAALLAPLPLLAVAVHLLWRRATYGAWLPNTYYAKNVEPWPESGWRYAASFVVENGVWVWLLLAAAWAAGWTVRALRAARRGARPPRPGAPAVAAVAVLAVHFLYYTLVIGGDHFEYRVHSHLVPLLFASGAWLAARLLAGSRRPALALALFVAASWPIPWVHWAATRGLQTREETHVLIAPIHDRFPAPLRPAVAAWDSWQAWLIRHHVGMRHQEHEVFQRYVAGRLPPRADGAGVRWADGRPVGAFVSVGVVGWVYPELAILDHYGLNDAVIARNPTPIAGRADRTMAHARQPPAGYLECFRPNARLRPDGRLEVAPRAAPLTDAEIRACEDRRWY
jgi:arabinofuranosyltransferase